MVKLEIILNDNGTLSVNGPIDNLHMCYGLLELAKDALREKAAQQRRIQPAAGPTDFMKIVGK